MSETKYLKCPCQKCGASIEFPAHGVGSGIPCPHCGEKTMLFAPPMAASSTAAPPEPVAAAPQRIAPVTVTDELSPSSNSPEPDKRSSEFSVAAGKFRSRWMAVTLSVVLLAGIGGALFVFRDSLTGSKSATSIDPALTGNVQALTAKNPDSPKAGSSVASAKTPKSPDDLKVGAITLEKAKGSSLVYAVGVLRNESEHQRFGVNIEVELADTNGAKAGVAKDYRSVVEPRREWRFRALVLDTKAVSAKLSKIREEE